MPQLDRSRFAPSTTGRAHAGTLLSALLAWCDARHSGATITLRLEDLDPQRCTAAMAQAMVDDLQWLGLTFDAVVVQSQLHGQHRAALDSLAGQGLLYACHCSRASLRAQGHKAPDGGFRYNNACRDHAVTAQDWAACPLPLRLRLDAHVVRQRAGGIDGFGERNLRLALECLEAFGDPVVRRRDNAIAYQLAVVVDDARAGITRVVRGRDIEPSTGLQLAIHSLLGLTPPVYWHHLLLQRCVGGKLAKLHGDAGVDVLQRFYGPQELCGVLAHLAGLTPNPAPCTPASLARVFDWRQTGTADRLVTLGEAGLQW